MNPFNQNRMNQEHTMGTAYRVVKEVHDELDLLVKLAKNVDRLRSGNIELKGEDGSLFWKYEQQTKWYKLGDIAEWMMPSLNPILASIQQLDNKVNNNKNSTDRSITVLNKSIKTIEGKVDKNTLDISSNLKSINNLTAHLNTLTKRVSYHDSQIENIINNSNQYVEALISALNTRFDEEVLALNSRIDGIKCEFVNDTFILVNKELNKKLKGAKAGHGFLDRNTKIVFSPDGVDDPYIELQPEGYIEDQPHTHNNPWSIQFNGKIKTRIGTARYYLPKPISKEGFYLSLNKGLVFKNTGSIPDFDNTVLFAYGLYNPVGKYWVIQGDERHSSQRNVEWHKSKHIEQGMVIRTLGSLDWKDNDPDNVKIQLTETVVADEDLVHRIRNNPKPSLPYEQVIEGNNVQIPTITSGSELWEIYTPYPAWTKHIPAFQRTGKSLKSLEDGQFMNYFLCATHCQKSPIKIILGRRAFDNLEDTIDEKLEDFGLNVPEIAVLYRITVQHKEEFQNEGKCVIAQVEQATTDIVFKNSAGTAGEGIRKHSELLGLQSEDCHPMKSITGLVETLEGLDTKIDEEIEAREEADEAILLALSNEETQREQGDIALNEKIDLEIQNRNEALTVLEGEVNTLLETKVDKVAGKGLSSNDYSDADKQKLDGLESSRWKGLFPNKTALVKGVINPQPGDYGDVDVGVGHDTVRWLWDENDQKWVRQGSGAPLTPVQIGQMYESLPNTNKFTDVDKTNLIQQSTVIPRAEAEQGVGSIIKGWTAQRVRQAILSWWNIATSGFGRNFIAASNEKAARNVLGLGTAATRDVGESSGNVMQVGAFGLGVTNAPGELLDNLDNIFHSGFYKTRGAAVGGSPHADGGCFVMVGLNDTKQLGWDKPHNLRFRGNDYPLTNPMVMGGWSDWFDIIHTGNVLSTTGQSTQYPMSQKATTDAINGISDERDKIEINEIGLGLEVIENLKTFSFKLNNRDWYRQEAAKELIEVEEEDGKVITQEKFNDEILNAPLSDFEENDGSLQRDDVYTGFVAQDLKETLKALDLGHLGIVKNYADEYEGGEDRFYIEHIALLPFLVNSIKQLSARVKKLEDAAEEKQ